MLQRCFWFLMCALLVLGVADIAAAQANTWPEYPFPNRHSIDRGPGWYLSWWKLLSVWLLMLFWVQTTDWANRDCQTLKMPYAVWNAVVFFPFFVCLIASFLLPSFWIALPLLVLSSTIPLGVYIVQRNGEVNPHERVLTPAHLRFLTARGLGAMGVKIAAEAKAAHEVGAPVDFKPQAAETNQENQRNLIEARQAEGFVPAKELVADAIDRRAEKVMLDFGRESVAVRYQIDGVWHELDPQARESGDAILHVLKTLSAMDPKERRERQSGELALVYKGAKHDLKIFSQGSKTGERVILQFADDAMTFADLPELGMRPKIEEQLKEMLAQSSGVFLFSSVPAGGLTTTMYYAMKITDRYLRDFVSFQAEQLKEPVAENIEVSRIKSGKGTPEEQLTSAFRREPNVVIVHEMSSGKIVEMMCQQSQRGKLILAQIAAKEAVEALLRVLLLKVSPKVFAPEVFGVLNQRLVRKLCEECKQPYTPPPKLLQKLGIPPGRIDFFYQPPDPAEVEEVCEHCGGIGYYGRIAVYELLPVDDDLRAAMIRDPKLETLRDVVRRNGHLGLQEEGLLLVAKGITSLAELQRVLKE